MPRIAALKPEQVPADSKPTLDMFTKNMEIVALVAMYSLTNFFNNVFDPEKDFPRRYAGWLDLNSLRSHRPAAMRAKGESEDRLQLLTAWHESPLYTDRERAALAWTHALTRLSETHAPDDVYAELLPHFSEEEIVKLTTLIGTMLNRFGLGFRFVHPVESAKVAAAR